MSVDFLDSNVFVYLFDEVNVGKKEVAQRLVIDALQSGSGCISLQVIQETLNVITRKIQTPVTAPDAAQFLDKVLTPLWTIKPTDSLYHRGLEIQDRFQFSFYDSLIVAAALEGGCERLLSEDLQNGQRIESLTVVNPFQP